MKTRLRTTVQVDKERTLVTRITTAVPMGGLLKRNTIRLGIGDDAALLTEESGYETVVSSDHFLEGIHFLEGKHPPEAVGYKALVRAMSDLSAMGATPRAFLLNLALAKNKAGAWLNRFLSGLRKASSLTGTSLIGGDLSRSKTVQISVVVIGRVARGQAILRSGAKPGDLIYVSGHLGLAALGLRELQKFPRRSGTNSPFIRAHLYPPIRLNLGEWLARKRGATSMMDISDGFALDLQRLCEASGVGARIDEQRVPGPVIPDALARMLRLQKGESSDLAFHGGDDYELLFTVPRKNASKLPSKFQGVPLTQVGEITREKRITLISKDGDESNLEIRGWDPFA
jgi:thiamine-monophosphate kinase